MKLGKILVLSFVLIITMFNIGVQTSNANELLAPNSNMNSMIEVQESLNVPEELLSIYQSYYGRE
ncbi:MAG TPA: hypothetical protein GX497_04770 [Bacillus bacterium]|nr:hypothetical protein [Bacillus sp. (in: firmicutes)]